jgi:hypothetical protein
MSKAKSLCFLFLVASAANAQSNDPADNVIAVSRPAGDLVIFLSSVTDDWCDGRIAGVTSKVNGKQVTTFGCWNFNDTGTKVSVDWPQIPQKDTFERTSFIWKSKDGT